MVPTENSPGARLAKQIIVRTALAFALLPGTAGADPCKPGAVLSGLGETGSSRAGLAALLACGSWTARLSGQISGTKRETGIWSALLQGPAGVITAGAQYLPAESSFLAQSWSVLEPPVRGRNSAFGGLSLGPVRAGIFGLEGSKRAGVFAASESFFAGLHPETGLGALMLRSTGPQHSALVDVTRLPDQDQRLTTEGYAGGSLRLTDWKLDAEAERRMSWDLDKTTGAVDPARRGRSGLLSAGLANRWLLLETGGQDRGRTGMRAIRTTVIGLADGWIVGPAVSLRKYERNEYGIEGPERRQQDSAAALGPGFRTENVELDVLGEFRRRGAPGAELRLRWKNKFLTAGVSAFAAAATSRSPASVHMLEDGSPSRSSRRFYAEETAAMVLSLQARWLYVYAGAARLKGRSSLYLHGEGRFEF